MIQLPNGCSCSDIKIHPTNWKKGGKALLNEDWYAYYRFYDPAYKDDPKLKKGKLVIYRGLKKFSDLEERREAASILLDEITDMLKKQGYNPISSLCQTSISNKNYIINPDTPMLQALNECIKRLQVVDSMIIDFRSVVKYFSIAATDIRLAHIPIKDVRRMNIVAILDRCGEIKTTWSANTYNYYIAHLRILFKELVEIEAIESNPLIEISKKKKTIQLRSILTAEQCIEVDAFAKKCDYKFWRLIHIFFHSGSRTTEIVQVQGKHVDLNRQQVKYLVKKGRQYTWVERPIKDIALPLWQEAMQNCGAEDYVFSAGLAPSSVPIRPEQLTRRWKRHIKDKLGIDCDWYSLKHLNTDQTSEQQGIHAASQMNSHKSTDITLKHYAVGETNRSNERLKKMNNQFGQSN
jgi:integrase